MFWRYSSRAQQPLLTLQEAASRKIVHTAIKCDIPLLPLPNHIKDVLINTYENFHHLQLSEYTTAKLQNSYTSTLLTFIEDRPLTETDYNMIYQYPRTFQRLLQPDQWQHVVRYFFQKTNLFREHSETFYLCAKCMKKEFQNNTFLLKKIYSHFTTSVDEISNNFDSFAKLSLCHNCLRTPIASILTESQCCAKYNRHYEAKCITCLPPFSCIICHHTTLKNVRWRESI